MDSHSLSEKELEALHERVKQDLKAFKDNTGCLELAFESAAKHMPVYLRIVKGHIEQLQKVLKLESHNQRDLENAGLAEPVVQLMQLFRDLDEEDIQMLEQLSTEARNWNQPEPIEVLPKEMNVGIPTEA